jgi:hypothetical protein
MRGVTFASGAVLVLGLVAQVAAAPPPPPKQSKQKASQAQSLVTPALPDLKVNRVFVAKWVPPRTLTDYQEIPATIKAGDKVYLVCEITNVGVVSVHGTYEVAFYDGMNLVGARTVTGAPQVGLLTKRAVEWTAAGLGSHPYRCVVDKSDVIKELDGTNELNNTKGMTLIVKTVLDPLPGAVVPMGTAPPSK